MTVALCRDVNIHISQELDIPRVIYSLPASFPLFSVRHKPYVCLSSFIGAGSAAAEGEGIEACKTE